MAGQLLAGQLLLWKQISDVFFKYSTPQQHQTNKLTTTTTTTIYPYAIKLVPPAPTPIRRVIDPTLEIIVLAAGFCNIFEKAFQQFILFE